MASKFPEVPVPGPDSAPTPVEDEVEVKALSTKISSDEVTHSISNSDSREIFDWIEEIVGSQFRTRTIDSQSEQKGDRNFSLLEFELGKDEPDEEDFLRCSLGEGIIIPLKVIYTVDGVRKSEQLVMRLPTYFFDFADDLNNDSSPVVITVHTHETYFYSTVLKDIQNFLQSEGVDVKLAIPQCFYVKHSPKYDMKKTPALIDNLMEAKTLLLVSDPKGEGFNELESLEDVDIRKGLAAMEEMAKIHAITWAIQEKTGKRLNDVWQDLLSVTDQEAINDHVIEGSFEFFSNGYDDLGSEDHPLYAMILFQRPKIERIVKETLYATGPEIPNSLLHMMVGGPNLFFRNNTSSSPKDDQDKVECCISSWSLATIGNPILDVALFTCVSLTPSVRSRFKIPLLERYWEVFTETAKLLKLEPTFTFAYIRQEFEKFQIWCFLFMLAACKQDEMKTEEMHDVLETILDILSNIPDKDA